MLDINEGLLLNNFWKSFEKLRVNFYCSLFFGVQSACEKFVG